MSRDEYHVEDIKCGEHTVRIYRDECPEDPYKAWDCFSTWAGIYEGDEVAEGREELPTDCIEDESGYGDYIGEYIYPRNIEGLPCPWR